MYTTEYYSATRKKETLLFMDLEDITLSEISQTEKDKSHLYAQSEKAEFTKTESWGFYVLLVRKRWLVSFGVKWLRDGRPMEEEHIGKGT